MENVFDLLAEQYDQWFEKNWNVFQSELSALRYFFPHGKKCLEIGVGGGVFAEQLGICHGVDPSGKMLAFAKSRGVLAVQGRAEDLPYQNGVFDCAVFITSLCFIRSPDAALAEAYRVTHATGELLIGYLDKDSQLGRKIESKKQESPFYRDAVLYSTDEMTARVEESGFAVRGVVRTLNSLDARFIEAPEPGNGQGGFVVVQAKKKE